MLKYFIISIIFSIFFPVLPAMGAEDPDELYRQGRFEEAESIYAELDMDQPKDIRFRYNRGCAAFQNSDFEGAAAAFKSVLRRSEDKETRFKASYNLASTAFKQGDLQSALEHYKQAIFIDPENEDARYNLELTLREIERQEKQDQENKENQDQGDQGEKGDQSDKQDNKDGDKKEEPKEPQEKDESGKEGEPEDQQDSESKNEEQGESKEQEKQDLSGDLSGPQDMPEQQMQEQEQPEQGLDRKKAEALLDNLNEDRSKMLRFQIPKDKRHGVASGKDW
jgi:Ca-activated chloride channel homolog